MAELYGPPNPYNAARSKAKKKAPPKADVPAPSAGVDAGQVQPNMLLMDDPFSSAIAVPSGMQSMPAPYSGPGSFDKRGQKVEQGMGRDASRTAYKTPGEYYSQLDTVLGSPLMQKLSGGVKNLEALRDQYLQHAPVQADLSPLMGLADFVAQGKGNALRSYNKPDNYNDLVAKLAGLMGQEQSAAYNQAQLAMNQVPLKAGEDQASVKAGVGESRDQGFQVPRPASMGAGMQNPLNQALALQRAFQNLRPYKEAEGVMAESQVMINTLKKPNWVADKELRGQMLQAMKLSPISEKEMAQFGSGSPDLFNKVRNYLTTGFEGRSLSPQDYKALEEFARAKFDYANKKMQAVQDRFANNMAPYAPAFAVEGIRGVTDPAVPPPTETAPEQQNESDKKFDLIMQQVFK